MSERKVINKFYPHDYDPQRIKSSKQNLKIDKQEKVRMMMPFSCKCLTCGNYMYIGSKYNMRKEGCELQYLDIKIFRFFWKCARCAAEITMRTDPKNNDYIIEHGASRNYDIWKDLEQATFEIQKQKQETAKDPMAHLEARTAESKKEMELIDTLERLRNRNKRLKTVDAEEVLENVIQERSVKQEAEEQLKKLKSYINDFNKILLKEELDQEDIKYNYVKRIDEDEEAFKTKLKLLGKQEIKQEEEEKVQIIQISSLKPKYKIRKKIKIEQESQSI